jgi:hypothetical protein
MQQSLASRYDSFIRELSGFECHIISQDHFNGTPARFPRVNVLTTSELRQLAHAMENHFLFSRSLGKTGCSD